MSASAGNPESWVEVPSTTPSRTGPRRCDAASRRRQDALLRDRGSFVGHPRLLLGGIGAFCLVKGKLTCELAIPSGASERRFRVLPETRTTSIALAPDHAKHVTLRSNVGPCIRVCMDPVRSRPCLSTRPHATAFSAATLVIWIVVPRPRLRRFRSTAGKS